MKTCDGLMEAGWRQFLRSAGFSVAGVAAATVMPTPAKAATATTRVAYPSNRLANLKDMKVNDPVNIAYPDNDSPGILLKLGVKVDGGVGPDGDVVAYSVLCPHKSYPPAYSQTDRTLSCPGHYSRFDVEKAGQEIWGHATQNLAQFVLRVNAKGDIYAEGVDELIYCRLSNVL